MQIKIVSKNHRNWKKVSLNLWQQSCLTFFLINNWLVHIVINCIFRYILAKSTITDTLVKLLILLFQYFPVDFRLFPRHCHTKICLQDAFKVQYNSFIRVQMYLTRVQEILIGGWLLATSSLTQMQFWNLAAQSWWQVCLFRTTDYIDARRTWCLSQSTTKPVHPAKTQISLHIGAVWPVLSVCVKKYWVLSYP